ncbi:hypothetical protein [Geodermatophilus sp. SYSU D01105]
MTEFETETTDSRIGVVRPLGRLNMVAAPRLRSLVGELVAGGRRGSSWTSPGPSRWTRRGWER